MGRFCPSSPLCLRHFQIRIPAPTKQKIDFGTDSLLLPPRTATIDLPECQERRGANKKNRVFEKASPAEGWRRLHKNMPTFGVSAALSTEHCRPQAGNVPLKGRLKVGGCLGVWGVWFVWGVWGVVVWGVWGVFFMQGVVKLKHSRQCSNNKPTSGSQSASQPSKPAQRAGNHA